MQTVNFDRESGIPIYRQLAEYLRSQISSGAYQPGDLLPSEADLMRDHKVSRTTARLAFDFIRNIGMIRREQGKGTIVVSQVKSNLPLLSSFTEEVERLGRKPGTVLLSKSNEKLPPEVASRLGLDPGEVVTKAVRLRTADGAPIGLAISWMNDKKFPELKEIDYAVLSLYQVYENQLGLDPLHANESASADLAGEFEARQLGIRPGAPILRLKRTTFVKSDREESIPIEYVDAVFNGYIYRIEIELYRHRGT